MLVLAGHCSAVQSSSLLRKQRQEDELVKVILSLANRKPCRKKKEQIPSKGMLVL